MSPTTNSTSCLPCSHSKVLTALATYSIPAYMYEVTKSHVIYHLVRTQLLKAIVNDSCCISYPSPKNAKGTNHIKILNSNLVQHAFRPS